MNEVLFVERREPDWKRLNFLTARADASPTNLQPEELEEFVRLYKRVSGDLAKVLHLDPSTLTGVLQQMGNRGLLQLQPDTRDRRRLRIQLTTKGRRMSHMAVGTIEAAVTRTLSRVSPAKLKATREVLALLADNLDRHGDIDTLTDQATSA